jgi:hypothetical protein
MKRLAAGLLVLVLSGCAGMDEFFMSDYQDVMFVDGDEFVLPAQAAPVQRAASSGCSSCGSQVIPAAYQPRSTQEPPLAR